MQTKPVFQTLLFVLTIGFLACSTNESQSTDANQPDSSTNTEVQRDPVAEQIASAKDAIKELQARLADTSLDETQRENIQKAISTQEEKIERFENLSDDLKKAFREKMLEAEKKAAQ